MSVLVPFKSKSIRPFIGSRNFQQSSLFYKEIGFIETVISTDMSLFSTGNYSFYLQDYYVKQWINNTILFLEVENLEDVWQEFNSLDLPSKFKGVKLSEIKHENWGKEFFLHDPSGVLWHFGSFH